MRSQSRARVRTRDSERGASALEFGLIAPLLIVLVLGIISYGYLLSFRQAISQGVAEGARAAAVAPESFDDATRQADAREAIDQALSSYGVTCGGGATCDISTPQECGKGAAKKHQCVRVEVTYPWESDPLVPIFPLIPVPDTLSYSAEVRVS